MRIIHVSTQKYHPCFLSTVFLQSQIHEVVFIVLNPREDPNYSVISRYDEDGVTYVHLNVRRDFDFSADPKLESAFLKIFKEFSPDVIHVQLFSGVNVLSVLRAGRGISAKKIITLHIHSLFCLSGACFDKGQVCLLNSLEECACENCRLAARRERLSLSKYNQIRKVRCQEIVGLADIVICCSRWQRDVLRRLLAKGGKTVVLYYGVNEPPKYKYKTTVTRYELTDAGINWRSFFKKVIKHGWGKQVNASTFRFWNLPDNERSKIQKVFGNDFKKLLAIMRQPIKSVRKKSLVPSFGYLGSLWELKGIEILLEAVHRLSHLRFQVLMGISLEPVNVKKVGLLKKLKENPLIRLMPNISREDLYERFFSQIDYLIIPSVWEETGPMPLFEAFYYKIPVIVSDRPSITEKTLPGVNSLVFDNVSTLTGIMKDLIEDRVRMAARTRKNFPMKTSREYETILEGIYSGNSDLTESLC